jgi:hypothetical protein
VQDRDKLCLDCDILLVTTTSAELHDLTLGCGTCRSPDGLRDMESSSRHRWVANSFWLVVALLVPIVLSSGSVWGKTHHSQAKAPSPAEDVTIGEAAQAPAPSDARRVTDLETAIDTAHELGMPRLAAYLQRVKAQLDGKQMAEAPSVEPAPAPESMKRKSKKSFAAPAPAPEADSTDEGGKHPYFKGQPLARTEADEKLYLKMKADKKKAEADGKASPITFPIIYLDQLYNVNDLEADEIFARGTAEIPSDIAKRGSLGPPCSASLFGSTCTRDLQDKGLAAAV